MSRNNTASGAVHPVLSLLGPLEPEFDAALRYHRGDNTVVSAWRRDDGVEAVLVGARLRGSVGEQIVQVEPAPEGPPVSQLRWIDSIHDAQLAEVAL